MYCRKPYILRCPFSRKQKTYLVFYQSGSLNSSPVKKFPPPLLLLLFLRLLYRKLLPGENSICNIQNTIHFMQTIKLLPFVKNGFYGFAYYFQLNRNMVFFHFYQLLFCFVRSIYSVFHTISLFGERMRILRFKFHSVCQFSWPISHTTSFIINSILLHFSNITCHS